MESRIHILGAGAIGRVFANRLFRAGVNTSLLLRSNRIEELKKLGFIANHPFIERQSVEVEVENILWEDQHIDHFEKTHIPFDTADNTGTEEISTVILLTKTYDAKEALEAIAPRLAKDSLIMVLCNGSLSLEEELMRSTKLGAASFVWGVTQQGAFRREPAAHPFSAVDAGGQGSCYFGLSNEGAGYSPISLSRYENALKLLNKANVKTTDETKNNAIRRRLWLKLGVNCVMNPSTSLLGCRNGTFLALGEAMPSALRSIESVCKEVAEVARHDHMCVPPITAQELVQVIMATVNRNNQSSMNQDILSGRRTEIDYINGYVAARANTVGTSAQVNDTLANLVRMKEEIYAMSIQEDMSIE